MSSYLMEFLDSLRRLWVEQIRQFSDFYLINQHAVQKKFNEIFFLKPSSGVVEELFLKAYMAWIFAEIARRQGLMGSSLLQ